MKVFKCKNTGIELKVFKNGKIIHNGKPLKRWINVPGYPYIQVFKNGVRDTYRVHVILARLFIPNPENKPDVNHKDGVKTNFKLNNLEWCTKVENMKHAVQKGLITNCCKTGENHNASKHTFKEIQEIRKLYSSGNISMRALAKQFKTSSGFISDVINNKRRTVD